MASRGFLIRFIDIGLIVLFGFLMISDIEASTRVDLAGGVAEIDQPGVEPEEDLAVITVDIGADGSFTVTNVGVEDGADDAQAPAAVRVTSVAGLTEALEAIVNAHAAGGVESVVQIQPHTASLVQFTVDVMDVCDRLGLQKSLRMDIELEAPGPGAVP